MQTFKSTVFPLFSPLPLFSPPKKWGNLISPLPLFSPPINLYKRKHKVISSERKQYICSMQLKKHIIFVFKITVYCVSLFFAMISLTMMFMCKSRSAFLLISFFKIAISFLPSTDAKYLATYQIFPPFITYLKRSKIDQVKILYGSFLK